MKVIWVNQGQWDNFKRNFYSDDQSWNPAEANSYSVKFVFEKNENKQKRGQGWPILKT